MEKELNKDKFKFMSRYYLLTEILEDIMKLKLER